MNVALYWRQHLRIIGDCAIAVLLVGAAAIATVLLSEIFPGLPGSLFFCAVMLSAWRGGLGPGLLASILSSAACVLWPVLRAGINGGLWAEAPRFLMLLFATVFISWLCSKQKRTQAALRQARDVLEQRVQDRTRELASSEAKLKEAQRLAKIGYWERDLVADRITWSRETNTIFGLSLPDGALTQARLQEMIYPDDRQLQRQALNDALQTGRSYDVEYRIVRPDGGMRFVHVRDEMEYDQSGRPVRMFGTVQDVSERRQAESLLKENEEKLHHAQAELTRVTRVTVMGELAASIAHEVNQPLVGVVTNANAAARWLAAIPPNVEEARQAVDRIARDGTRASEVIKRIRALFRKQAPIKTQVNLNELIQETLALTQLELTCKQVVLQTELMPKLPFVTADRVQLQQVLINLFVNALDSLSASRAGLQILRVRTELSGPRTVQVTVEDNGGGIAHEAIERVFEPFYTTKKHGLGMGLPISRSIVEAHGGRLWATPRKSAPGVTFEFTLPVDNGGEV
jgi:PAS domain S-box-containing protein